MIAKVKTSLRMGPSSIPIGQEHFFQEILQRCIDAFALGGKIGRVLLIS
jgi:hypothetical protein